LVLSHFDLAGWATGRMLAVGGSLGITPNPLLLKLHDFDDEGGRRFKAGSTTFYT